MKFETLPQSTHDLVVLRPFTTSDLSPWFNYLSLPVIYEHTSWDLRDISELLPYVWVPEQFTPSSLLRFAIALRTTNELVGTAGFHSVSPQNNTAELVYDLAPTVWGKGIATYVCGLLVAWAHAHVGLIRVQATVLESNVRSKKVLQRCGFEHEGVLRNYRMVRGTPGNFSMYSHIT